MALGLKYQLIDIIFCQLMLKGLIKSLKSEQASKHQKQVPSQTSSKEKTGLNVLEQVEAYQIDLEIMDKESIEVGSIKRVRYFVLPGLPDFSNLVMGCPLSVFNLLPHSQRKVKEIDLAQYPFPAYLRFMLPLLQRELPNFNHILINAYPSSIGIMPHSDGPAYYGRVVVISLGSYAIIRFQQGYTHSHAEQEEKIAAKSILLEPHSVHIFEEAAYQEFLHGIPNMAIDSVFFKFSSEAGVTHCSIENYQQLECRTLLEEIFSKMIMSEEDETVLQEGTIRVVQLVENSEFNFKAEFERRERISITIRHKFLV